MLVHGAVLLDCINLPTDLLDSIMKHCDRVRSAGGLRPMIGPALSQGRHCLYVHQCMRGLCMVG